MTGSFVLELNVTPYEPGKRYKEFECVDYRGGIYIAARPNIATNYPPGYLTASVDGWTLIGHVNEREGK